MSDEPLAHHSQRLPEHELFVLCTWAVQATADQLRISEDDAYALLAAAHGQGRVQVLGNTHFAGVQVDGEWVVVEGRGRLTDATREWQALRALEHQFEQSED